MITTVCTVERKTSEWKAIARNFPFLETLEIVRGGAIQKDVEIIHALLPNCEVRLVTKPVAFRSENVDATLQFEMAI